MIPVIFRKIRGEVIAFFPTVLGTYDPHSCLSYMRVGQHGSAEASAAYTSPATAEEYAPLLRELESIGYELEVKGRFTSAHFRARLEALCVN